MTASEQLDLLADTEHTALLEPEEQWHAFCLALTDAVDGAGWIDPNRLRPLVRECVPNHKKRGAFTSRAIAEGLIRQGAPVRSTDVEGRNGGKWIPSYWLVGGAS